MYNVTVQKLFPIAVCRFFSVFKTSFDVFGSHELFYVIENFYLNNILILWLF